MHLPGGLTVAYGQCGGHLGGRAVPAVARPVGPLVIAGAPAGEFGDR